MLWSGVKQANLDKVMPVVEDIMADFFKRFPDYSQYALEVDLQMKNKQLWLGGKDGRIFCAAITLIDNRPEAKVCVIWAAVGIDSTANYQPLMDLLIPWARQHGCDAIECNGRAGWERVLGKRGWKKSSTTMRMEL